MKIQINIRNSHQFLATLLLSSFSCYIIIEASCGDIVLSQTVLVSTVHTNIVNMSPQFTDVTVTCETDVQTLCSRETNVADTTISLDTTIPGIYTNLNDYNFLRSNKSIFSTFGNQLVLTLTFTTSHGSGFGAAVAISGDGSTAAIGCRSVIPPLPGFVNIYKRHGSTWKFLQQITPPSDFPLDPIGNPYPATFGSVLYLSYDGSVLAIGAIPPQEQDFAQPAYAFMYDYDITQDTYVVSQQIPGSGSGGFASVLALSANGKYLVVNDDISRSFNADWFFPTTWIYEKNDFCSYECNMSPQWTVRQRLTPIDNNTLIYRDLSSVFGQYLSISADGSVIAMGLPWRRVPNTGAINGMVVIFTRVASTWQQSQIIISPEVSTASRDFGTAVSLSADGTYLSVGDPGTLGQPSQKVFVFAKRGDSYVLEATLFSPRPGDTQFRFGVALSLSADGTVLVIGEGHQFNGDVYIAIRGPDNRWTMPFRFQDPNFLAKGASVSCSADGSFVIIGAPSSNNSQGAALIFRSTGSCISNDTTVTGTLCIHQQATINAPLHLTGNIHVNNTIVTGTGLAMPCAAELSDDRIKDNITRLNPAEALERLRSIKPVTFFWKDTVYNSSSRQVGFIAQQMKEILPHWVTNKKANTHEQYLLDGTTKYIITMKAELYAYLIAALEKLIQHNAEQRQAIEELQRQK